MSEKMVPTLFGTFQSKISVINYQNLILQFLSFERRDFLRPSKAIFLVVLPFPNQPVCQCGSAVILQLYWLRMMCK